MKPVEELISRFVEDPGAATPEELDALIEALHEEPAMVVRLREQLMLNDLLAQKLTVDRRNFLAQVEQRIADYERGQEEIDSQVSDLRAIAETEIERPRSVRGTSLWMNLLMVAAAAALIAGVFIAPGFLQQGRAVARVESVEGEAIIFRDQMEVPLQAGAAVLTGQPIRVAAGALLVLEYADRTRVELTGGSLTLASDPKTRAKQVRIESGEVFASVAKQTAGPMLFQTPHAVATVLGTELRITVADEGTRLDVTEGLVQFAKKDGGDPVLVAASETSEVRGDQVQPKRSLTWPDERESVVFLFEGTDKLTLARNPASGYFRDTPLEPVGEVEFGAARELLLRGGQFVTADGGLDVVRLVQRSSQFTLETVLAAQRSRASGAIVALAFSGGRGNFELAQEDDQLVFRLAADRTADGPALLELGRIEADRQLHVAVSYRDGVLCGYVDGKEVARREDVHGGLGGWSEGALAIGGDSVGGRRWRGSVAGVAIHDRALDAAEIARNTRNFVGLHATAAREPRWISLMTDADPASHAAAGTWTTVDYAWASGGTGERLSLTPVKGDFDVRLELHVLQSAGEPIELLLPVGNRHVAVVLRPAGSSSTVNGLDLIDLRPAADNRSGLADRQLELQRIYAIEGQVRVLGEKASVLVSVDGEPWVEWTGPRESLSLRTERQDWAEPSPVLSVGKNVVQVHSLKVRRYP